MSITYKHFEKALSLHFDGYEVYLWRYPKAAKKKKNRKKWLKRFGTPLKDALFKRDPLLSRLKPDNYGDYINYTIEIPLFYGDENES